jgi:N utilization substance protein B
MAEFSPAARRKAREFAMQALYQWHVNHESAGVIEAQFQAQPGLAKADKAYFSELLRAVIQQSDALDALLQTVVDRELKSLTPVELSILRMGAYELQTRLEIPYRVVLNEAVALAKKFGATQGHRYVNAVLDQLSRSLRHIEHRA